jgi:hypothetical protein
MPAGVQTGCYRWPRQKGFVAMVDRGGFDLDQEMPAGRFGGGGNIPDFQFTSFGDAYGFHCDLLIRAAYGAQRPSDNHNPYTNFLQVRIFLLV